MEKGVILKSPGTVRKLEFKNQDFVVENYSVRKGIGVGKAISSEEIMVGGHRWFIRLFPVGQDEDAHNQGFASLSIHLMSETAEAVAVLVDLCIVNQSGKGKHCSISSFTSKDVRHLNCRGMTGSPRLIRRAELESPTSGYLKDDTLKIVGSIGVFSYHTRNQIESNIGVGVDFGKLLELQWLDEFVFFRVEDLTYCAGKSILAARCRALLPHDGDQDDIVVPDVQPQIFMAVLYFIHTGTLRKTVLKDFDDSDPLNLESFAAKLLAAADKFELRELKKICELSISKKVCRESVASLLCLADVCKAADLKSACLKFAAENQSVIMEATDGCELLKETCPLLFLELAGFGDKSSFHDNPSTNRKGVLNTSNKVISTVRESFVWRHWNWSAAHTKQKIKEV